MNHLINILESSKSKNFIKFELSRILIFDKKFTKAKKLVARTMGKDLDSWVKEAEDRTNEKLTDEINNENERLDREGDDTNIEEGDFGNDFDYDADDSDDDSNINGDL